MSTTITTSYYILVKKLQLTLYFLMSATSLVFSSRLSLPLTLLLTTILHTLKSTTITTAYHILVKKKNSINVIYPNVSDLPGLLLLVIFAVQSAVDHQTTWAKSRQVLQNSPWAANYHFGASWKAVIARSLTFEQRQIECQSWWQNWPILCALQLCFCEKHLNKNSLGSRRAITKI